MHKALKSSGPMALCSPTDLSLRCQEAWTRLLGKRPTLQFQVEKTFHYDVCTMSKADPGNLPISEKSQKGRKRIRTVEFINGIPPLISLVIWVNTRNHTLKSDSLCQTECHHLWWGQIRRSQLWDPHWNGLPVECITTSKLWLPISFYISISGYHEVITLSFSLLHLDFFFFFKQQIGREQPVYTHIRVEIFQELQMATEYAKDMPLSPWTEMPSRLSQKRQKTIWDRENSLCSKLK